ncbi:MAG: metallophosphoesterase family protein [Chitinophagales bacterium]
MAISRKYFLQQTLRGIFVIGFGNSIQAFKPADFQFPDADEIKWRFAVASDGHYGQPSTDYEIYHDNMTSWLNEEKKQRGLEFSIINGDLFHDNASYLPQVKSKWDKLATPLYVSHGNHDLINEEAWQKVWRIPFHHSFEVENAGFLILNTADQEGKFICPDLDWTRLALDRMNSKDHLYIFMHITPIKWTKSGIDCPELVSLFSKQENLRAIFHGHDHDEDNVKERDSKHYFFDSHIGGNWGTPYHGYRIVELLKSGEILTYQMNPTESKQVNEWKIKK